MVDTKEDAQEGAQEGAVEGSFLPDAIRTSLVEVLLELPMVRVEGIVRVVRNLPRVRVPKENIQ